MEEATGGVALERINKRIEKQRKEQEEAGMSDIDIIVREHLNRMERMKERGSSLEYRELPKRDGSSMSE